MTNRTESILFLAVLFLAVLLATLTIAGIFAKATTERDMLQEEFIRLQEENELFRQQIEELQGRQEGIYQDLEKWLNGWEEYDISFYAPLDESAKEGMCFSGNRTVTASGMPVEIGRTVAADLPFGTELYIENYGWRTVQDRGGEITEGRIDIAVETVEEALRLGRRTLRVWRSIRIGRTQTEGVE